MAKPHVLTNEEQIAIIEQVVDYGWSISEVIIDSHTGGTVRFRRANFVQGRPVFGDRPFPRLDIETSEITCGVVAAMHAREIMGDAVIHRSAQIKNELGDCDVRESAS